MQPSWINQNRDPTFSLSSGHARRGEYTQCGGKEGRKEGRAQEEEEGQRVSGDGAERRRKRGESEGGDGEAQSGASKCAEMAESDALDQDGKRRRAEITVRGDPSRRRLRIEVQVSTSRIVENTPRIVDPARYAT
uniref:Uncharacterized protein n=1 Tax=Globodera rostochiensis TaxID=31243 RepID=A0A914IDE8_GLORO